MPAEARAPDRCAVSIESALARPAAFDALIDVRSESEFAVDHIPGAISCPVLDDAERAEVGQLHRVSPFRARQRGAALVARNIARHLEATFADKPPDWLPLVYCWRGGQRSAALTLVLDRIGWRARRLEGGYRAFRRHVVAALEELPARFQWRVICGTTGSGKSRLLQALHESGAQVLDLESLAHHRGSVLGHLPALPQPSQKAFETRIWSALRGFDPARPVFVESESRKVGDLRVPDALIGRMRASECIVLSTPMSERVRLLREEYRHFEIDPQALRAQLVCLAPLHGRQRIEDWIALCERGDWDALVQRLLAEHYDPAYLRSIARNYPRATGAREARLPAPGADDFAALARQLLSAP